jgi:hypothetical protein
LVSQSNIDTFAFKAAGKRKRGKDTFFLGWIQEIIHNTSTSTLLSH